MSFISNVLNLKYRIKAQLVILYKICDKRKKGLYGYYLLEKGAGFMIKFIHDNLKSM